MKVKPTYELIGLVNEEGTLVYASECNSQIEGSDYDGPVLWENEAQAEEILEDTGGIPDGHRLVKVSLFISELDMV